MSDWASLIAADLVRSTTSGISSYDEGRIASLLRKTRSEALEAAALMTDAINDQWIEKWRAGRKSDSHLEGKSDGADDIAAAIRALKGTAA